MSVNNSIRLEAENMFLSGNYQVENQSFASQGGLIGLTGITGSATTSFSGATGEYDVVVGFYDEIDGESQITVNIDGNTIDSWVLDNSPGGSRATTTNFTLRTIATGITITQGSELELIGLQHTGENSRIDYVEFIPVYSGNEAPIAIDDSYTTSKNVELAIAADGVLANDSDGDGDFLSVSNFDTTSGEGGIVTLDANGSFIYTPPTNFTGLDSFTYTVSDGNGGISTATVNLAVDFVNVNPIAASDSFQTNEDDSLTILAVDLLGNDIDGNGDELAITSLTNPVNGSLSSDDNGGYIYTPNPNFFGTDIFTYTVEDGNGGTSNTTVTITVNPLNDNPLATDDTFTVLEGNSLVITSSSLIGNDSDEDGDTISISNLGIPTQGTLTSNDDNTYTYTPHSGFIGEDTLTYTISDGNGGTATGEITVTVNPPFSANSDPIRLEAEDMLLSGNYQVQNKSFASQGGLIGLTGITGSAITSFSGATGTYDVVVGYYDEIDGESQITVKIDGNTVDSWVFNENLGGSRATTTNFTLRTVATDLEINSGSSLELIGLQHAGENSRIDYVEFIPVDSPTLDDEVPTASLNASPLTVNQGSTQDYLFTVEYEDNFAIDSATFDSQDLRVVSSNGFNSLASLVSVNETNHSTVVTYGFTPAGGSWDTNETGFYSITMEADQVTDLQGNAVASGTLGSFEVQVISPEIPEGEIADYSNATNGVILNLDTEVALSPVFGALDVPRIMPLGDSITAGEHSKGALPGGYRIQFWERALADGLTIDFVGGKNNGSEALGDGDHEGRRGWAIDGIKNLIRDGQLDNYPSDAIMLMIGTNNANAGGSGAHIASRLSLLIDEIASQAPDTYLFVSSIPPMDGPRGTTQKNQNIDDFNALIPDLVAQKTGEGKKVFFADAGGSLTFGDMNGDNSFTNDLNDGIHPSFEGYGVLGDAWYNAVFNPESLAGISNLIGSEFSDRLTGNSSSNILVGGAGEDQLTGGGGADIFVYQNAAHGLDEIIDFDNNDLVQFSAAGFNGFVAGTNLGGALFISDINPMATLAEATLLYDTGTNTLSFDADGVGDGVAIAIATFSNGYDLQAHQIEIVA